MMFHQPGMLAAGLFLLFTEGWLHAEVIGVSTRAISSARLGFETVVDVREGVTGASASVSESGFQASSSGSASAVVPGAPLRSFTLFATARASAPGDAERFPHLDPVSANASAFVTYTNSEPVEVLDVNVTTSSPGGGGTTTTTSFILPPGLYNTFVNAGALLSGFPDLGFAQSQSWTFTRTFFPANTNVIRWINPSGGSYFDAANWNPARVPRWTEQQADVAVFDLAGNYVVTLTPPAAAGGRLAAAGTPGPASADRWIVRAGNQMQVNGDARVFSGSIINPSITVQPGGRLNLFGGILRSSHASIGHEAGAGDADVLLANTDSQWFSDGRMTIGREGPGVLQILNGTLTNAETRLGGDATASGSARVAGPDAYWQTGNASIGYNLGASELRIEDGGRATSELAVVGFGSGRSNAVTIDGTYVGETEGPSTWTVRDELLVGSGPGSPGITSPSSLGSAGTVEVLNGASLAGFTVRVGSGQNSEGRLVVRGVSNSTARRPSTLTGVSLVVGGSGQGNVVIADGAEVSVGEIILEGDLEPAGNVVSVTGGFDPGDGTGVRPSKLSTATIQVGPDTSVSVGDGAFLETFRMVLTDEVGAFPGLDLSSGERGRSEARIGTLFLGSPAGSSSAEAGFPGFAEIEGGSLLSAGTVQIGGQSDEAVTADGQIRVRGVGVNGFQSQLMVSNILAVGFDGGPPGIVPSLGELLVEEGGRVGCDSLFVGGQAHGWVEVTGSGFGLLTQTPVPSYLGARDMYIGRAAGRGNLLIADGGQVYSDEGLYIGSAQETGLTARVDVRGQNSLLESPAFLSLGALSRGQSFLIVEDGAQVRSGPADIGSDSVVVGNARSRAFLVGTNDLARTSWNITGDMRIADCLGCLGSVEVYGGAAVVHVEGNIVIGEFGAILGSGTIIADGVTNPLAAAFSPAGAGANAGSTPTIFNRGTIAASSADGGLRLIGNLEQSGTGRIRVELGPRHPGSPLQVSGQATLDGMLEVVFQDHHLPTVGETIPVLDVSGSTQGAFTQTRVLGQPYNGRIEGVFSNGGFLVTSVLRTNYQVMHTFGPTNVDGINGWGPLTAARDGWLYGCARNGGPEGAGAIFRLRPEGYGYEVLHFFSPTNDGAQPLGGVVQGGDGAFYGTTSAGGANGAGTIWRLAGDEDGGAFRVLRHFRATNDCRFPQSELIEGRDGLLYGTTLEGGGSGRGGAFAIGQDGSGYRILTGFGGGEADAPRLPVGGLVEGPDGALYGTTEAGGAADRGTVFRLTTNGAYTVLRSLGNVATGAASPNGTLLLDSSNTLYGTTYAGGTSNFGTIFRLTLDGSGFSVIKNFGATVGEGREPRVGLVEAPDGSLLGTTRVGGSGAGTIFRLRKDGSGFQTLRFFGAPGDGARPRSTLAQAPGGVFYGLTFGGGTNDQGVLFRLFTPGIIPPPTLATQPQHFIGPPGSTVTLQVQAAGSEPFFYQWQRNGADLPGANLSTLALPAVNAASVGAYAVRVSGLSGTNLSAPASVTLFNINPDRSMTLLGEPGAPHRIDFTDALTLTPQNWQPLTNVALPAGPISIVDPHSAGLNQRFYRAVRP